MIRHDVPSSDDVTSTDDVTSDVDIIVSDDVIFDMGCNSSADVSTSVSNDTITGGNVRRNIIREGKFRRYDHNCHR
jgi:hypothetical protein